MDLAILRLLSIVSILLAIALIIAAMTTRSAPQLPGYLAFLFMGLVGSSAERSVRALQRLLAALEARKQQGI